MDQQRQRRRVFHRGLRAQPLGRRQFHARAATQRTGAPGARSAPPKSPARRRHLDHHGSQRPAHCREPLKATGTLPSRHCLHSPAGATFSEPHCSDNPLHQRSRQHCPRTINLTSAGVTDVQSDQSPRHLRLAHFGRRQHRRRLRQFYSVHNDLRGNWPYLPSKHSRLPMPISLPRPPSIRSTSRVVYSIPLSRPVLCRVGPWGSSVNTDPGRITGAPPLASQLTRLQSLRFAFRGNR